MPVKTVTILVQAMTDRANAQVKATSAIFDELRDKSPIEMRVKFDKAQAIAESRILAKEMSATVRDVVKLQADADGAGLLARLFQGLKPDAEGRSLLERLIAGAGGGSLPARLFKGGGGAGAGLPGPLGAIPVAGTWAPVAVIAAVAAGLTALPFLAQAAAGAITLALGGGLAALGVAGALGIGKTVLPGQITAAQDALKAAQLRQIAAQDKLNQLMAAGATSGAKLASAQAAVASSSGSVATAQDRLNQLLSNAQTPAQLAARKALTNLTSQMQDSLSQIGKSFAPVLLSVFSTAGSVLGKLTPVLAAAVAAIAGPVKLIGDTLLRSFASPQVVTMIKELAVAFGALLKAFAPSIPGIVTSIADGFTNIFRAIAKNPKAFADMATALFHLIGVGLDVLAWLTQVASYIELHFIPAWQHFRSWIEKNFVQVIVRFFTSTLPTAFDIWKESVRVVFDAVEIAALKTVLGITVAFGHLPGPLGAPFRAASAGIRLQLAAIQGDSANAVANIKADWAKLNGTSANLFVYTNFVNVGTPPAVGGIFPTPTGAPPGTRRLAVGTMSAVPGWAWVGERGPELAYFRGGETVIPAWAARGYARGAGFGGTGHTEALLADLIDAVDNVAAMIGTLTGVTAQGPAAMGAAMAMGGRSAVYGALYP